MVVNFYVFNFRRLGTPETERKMNIVRSLDADDSLNERISAVQTAVQVSASERKVATKVRTVRLGRLFKQVSGKSPTAATTRIQEEQWKVS